MQAQIGHFYLNHRNPHCRTQYLSERVRFDEVKRYHLNDNYNLPNFKIPASFPSVWWKSSRPFKFYFFVCRCSLIKALYYNYFQNNVICGMYISYISVYLHCKYDFLLVIKVAIIISTNQILFSVRRYSRIKSIYYNCFKIT